MTNGDPHATGSRAAKLAIWLTEYETRIVLQAFSLSDERFIERSVDREIKEREVLEERFSTLQRAHQSAMQSQRLAVEVNRG